MEFSKVTAIFRNDALKEVEDKLKGINISGITVTRVKGFGEYANFFSRDWLSTHTRIEIFTSSVKAEKIARTIMEAANYGAKGDGIVAILPVEKVFRIRSMCECKPEKL